MNSNLKTQQEAKLESNNSNSILKFILFSGIGIFMFFIPITIAEKSTIPLDHLVSAITTNLPSIAPIYALIIILLGALRPFLKKTWNTSKVKLVFSMLNIIGVISSFAIYFKFGPAWLMEGSMGPFLFNKLVIPVGLIVPIGAVFLAFLVGFGLLEFIGIIVNPFMKKVFKTPGRSAVDAVASFVGSYSIGLLITNRVFKEGKYTIKEASIIATGFSTVSATFMIVVAKTLGLMDIWNLYFWSTLLITFIVTAITVRIRPLSKKSDEYYNGMEGANDVKVEGNPFVAAWNKALEVSGSASGLGKSIYINLKDGLIMAMGILPSIMSVGLIGLVLANYTPVFDIVGYIFYPFVLLLQAPDAMLLAKAAAVGVAEMFLPALLVVDADQVTRFVVGITSVSSILFFSASVPTILSTDIPISIKEIVIIWFERTLLTLLIALPFAYFIL